MTESILAPVAALTLPDSVALTGNAQRALSFIESFEIATGEDYSLAADELKAVKSRMQHIEKQRTAITGPINTALRAINDLFRGPGELLGQAESVLKRKMLAWDQEQERIAREARARAEAIATAERKRLEDEAAAQQREAAAQVAAAAAARAVGDEQAAALASAAAARANSEAQAAATTAQIVVAPVVQIDKPKAVGISTSKRINFEVIDLAALVRHISTHPELLALIRADDVNLRAYVKGVGTACALPGVRVFEDRVMSARAA